MSDGWRWRHGLLFGAAYYPEYQTCPDLDRDMRLMLDAGFTVIRVGESVWSTWEPRDGEFELDWLRPTLDAAYAAGIKVVLGTPTYAVPPWMQVAYPEIAGEIATGVRRPWGARQEVDFTHPTFRFYAGRVIRAILETYADHPAVIGYQVDNEPGLLLFHNDHVFRGFVDRLRTSFRSVEALNDAWGLAYWSHRLAHWDELWRPDGNSFPQYDLEWRRYQADLTREFVAWQVELVRQYAAPDQFVMTCMSYKRPAMHDGELAAVVDITAGNPYHGSQDGLDLETEALRLPTREATGVWGLLRLADRLFSSRQDRFLVTELQATSTDSHAMNFPPYRGQLRQSAFAFIARGALMIEYWHWNTLRAGTETYWSGVLPHSGRPGRVYDEIASIGADLRRLEPVLDDYTPHHDVTMIYSNPSRWAMEFFPALLKNGMEPDERSYTRIFDATYRGLVESGAQVRIVQPEQLAGMDAVTLAALHPTLVAVGLYIADGALLNLLAQYVKLGGHLVLGPRTAVADDEARAWEKVTPAFLDGPAGVHYEFYSNLLADVLVVGDGMSEAARATAWLDGLEPDGAEVLARFDHPEFGEFAAITRHSAGAGTVTTVGTVPNPALARDVARLIVPAPCAAPWLDGADSGVLVNSGSSSAGTVIFVHNWSGHESAFTTPAAATSVLDNDVVAPGERVTLPPRAVRVYLIDPANPTAN